MCLHLTLTTRNCQKHSALTISVVWVLCLAIRENSLIVWNLQMFQNHFLAVSLVSTQPSLLQVVWSQLPPLLVHVFVLNITDSFSKNKKKKFLTLVKIIWRNSRAVGPHQICYCILFPVNISFDTFNTKGFLSTAVAIIRKGVSFLG